MGNIKCRALSRWMWVYCRGGDAISHSIKTRKSLKTVDCKMAVRHFIGLATVSLWLLIVVVVGMHDVQGQFRKTSSSSVPRSSPLLYARPPVQVLEGRPPAPRNGKNFQQPTISTGNSANNVKAIPYGYSNPQQLPPSNGVVSRGNNQVNERDSLPNRDTGKTESNELFQQNPLGNNLGKDFPIFTAPSNINNDFLDSKSARIRPPTATSTPQFPALPNNVQNANPAKASLPNTNHPSIFDNFNIGQKTNFGQQFSTPPNNHFFKPPNTAQESPAPPSQEQNGNNYIPILARGFSVPTTYSDHQDAGKPEQFETLSAVANPSDNKREVIGSYLPRNDFVNPELFVIPTEDKHNIVSRIFGGFKTPTVEKINPQTPNLDKLPYPSTPTENYANNLDFFNKQNPAPEQRSNNLASVNSNGHTISSSPIGKNANPYDLFNSNRQSGSLVPSDTTLNGARESRESASRTEPENFSRDNSINLNKFDPVLLPQGNGNRQIPNFDKSYTSLGTFTVPNNKRLTFDGGVNNPGSFTGSKQSTTFSTNSKAATEQNGASQNIGNNKEQFNLLNINAFPGQQKSLFENAQDFNNNQTPFGNKGFGIQLNFGSQSQVGKPTKDGSTTDTTSRPVNDSPRQPLKFNSIDSFQGSDLFLNPKQGFGRPGPVSNGPAPVPNRPAPVSNRPAPVSNNDANVYKERNVFMDQPAHVPLFSDFSQARPLTVDGFRSKNLLGDENFGRTEYDRTRPTSLNVFRGENDFFGGDKFFEGHNLNFQTGNRNLGKGSDIGTFQQVDGNAITKGDSYDNVFGAKQGYSKNFNDNSDMANNKPSSFTKEGGFTNAYQQTNGYDRAGSVNNGNDYGSRFAFKDGDSVSNQKTSSNHNEGNFRNSFEDQQHSDDQKSYSNADGYNNAFVNGRRYDLSDGYTDNVNYNTQNSGSSQYGVNNQDEYGKGVAKVAANLASQRPDFYDNLPQSISDGLPEETSYKPFNINKPVFNGVVLS